MSCFINVESYKVIGTGMSCSEHCLVMVSPGGTKVIRIVSLSEPFGDQVSPGE